MVIGSAPGYLTPWRVHVCSESASVAQLLLNHIHPISIPRLFTVTAPVPPAGASPSLRLFPRRVAQEIEDFPCAPCPVAKTFGDKLCQGEERLEVHVCKD